MISISRLLCDNVGPSDSLRYGNQRPDSSQLDHPGNETPRPIVVWNCTRQCNLHCIHCYANASTQRLDTEMDTQECLHVIDEILEVGKPFLILSRGEPFLRQDFFQIAKYAADRGLRVVVGTNGTLVTGEIARRLREIPISQIGVSVDFPTPGLQDQFRGKPGAFEAALAGGPGPRSATTHSKGW